MRDLIGEAGRNAGRISAAVIQRTAQTANRIYQQRKSQIIDLLKISVVLMGISIIATIAGICFSSRTMYAVAVFTAMLAVFPYALLHHVLAEIFGNPKDKDYVQGKFHYLTDVPTTLIAVVTSPPLVWGIIAYLLMLLNPERAKEQLVIIFLGSMLLMLFSWRYGWRSEFFRTVIWSSLVISLTTATLWLVVANVAPLHWAELERWCANQLHAAQAQYIAEGTSAYGNEWNKPNFNSPFLVRVPLRVYASGLRFREDMQYYEQVFVPPKGSRELRRSVSKVIWVPANSLLDKAPEQPETTRTRNSRINTLSENLDQLSVVHRNDRSTQTVIIPRANSSGLAIAVDLTQTNTNDLAHVPAEYREKVMAARRAIAKNYKRAAQEFKRQFPDTTIKNTDDILEQYSTGAISREQIAQEATIVLANLQ
ncbi:hypothetical protein KKF64_00480 [Patescibacteria group bacterium]|nr:hypothetical protein [Patescibacteria group bacterium]